MSALAEQLQSILGHLRRLKRPVAGLLQDPLDPEDVRLGLQRLQLCPSNALSELYSWRNGTKVEGSMLCDLHFFPGYYYMPFDHALDAYKIWSEGYWDPRWFPIFTNNCGDFYAVQLSQDPTQDGPVIWSLRGEPDQSAAFDSLLNMARTISACYEAGAYFLTNEGDLDIDYDAAAAITRKLNPSLDLYKE